MPNPKWHTRRVKLEISLDEEIYDELVKAARQSGMRYEAPSPALFAEECVESVLASRRLERIGA